MESHFIDVNNLKIHYLEDGKENNNLVLLIHGLGSSAERWLIIQKEISKKHHTIAIDLPGFGQSDKPQSFGYTISNFKDIVTEFMKKIKPYSGKTCLVGHSLGGYIALDVAAEPRTIDKLVLIDSSGMLSKPTLLLREYLEAAIKPARKKVREVFGKMVADPNRVPDYLVEGFISRVATPDTKISFQKTLDNSANKPIDISKLNRITTPTLILWGKEDKVIPLEHAYLFHEQLPESRLEIIQDAGHAPFAEKPAQVIKLIDSFCSN